MHRPSFFALLIQLRLDEHDKIFFWTKGLNNIHKTKNENKHFFTHSRVHMQLNIATDPQMKIQAPISSSVLKKHHYIVIFICMYLHVCQNT